MMLTQEEVLAELEARGYEISPRRLVDWRQKGLLPPLVKHGRGRGRAWIYVWEEPLIVEEAFAEEPAAETHVAEPPRDVEPEPADEPEPPGEPTTSDFAPPAEAAEPGTSEEDVLEETPEFLRENPDDDELWFEQGEPKDFDF